MASKDPPGGHVAVDAVWITAPDYRKMAHELARLGAEAAQRAQMTGNRRYDRLAHTLTDRAGEILNDLDRAGKAG
ncbi:hypothetical protein AZL_025850 [Azospirillum sp. B510]|uniref:hypothetical protein n=1 Tax=Azospirillum sp. (strain B510) TaxID=137722 RepID=UPI0001C4CC7B|nr:hypothetical protein [Azospirillum sp. B510]BAI73223.1 hypothetical protein AZL_025850 [Azospirillum sp. B510]